MDNDEIFQMNEELYTKLASYNENYHLYSSNCKINKSSINCKRQNAELNMEYEHVKNSMESLLGLLKNSNNFSRDNVILL